MEKIKIDVMVNNGSRFYRTLVYEFNPLFKFDLKALSKWVHQRCPLLKYEKGIQLIIEN